jgi:DNA-binding XRE family transcriptional regulator
MDFWMRLKNKIKACNTTQEWVAGEINVPFSTFRKWFVRKTYPDAEQCVKIARLLNVTVEYLVSGKDEFVLYGTEKLVINQFRKLGEHDKENILIILDGWTNRERPLFRQGQEMDNPT